MSKAFRFTHNYHKLKMEAFIAVRGITRSDQYKVGDRVDLVLKGKLWGKGVITKMYIEQIALLSVPFFRHSCNYGNINVTTEKAFIAHLNSTRHYKSRITDRHKEIAVFNIKKVRD